MLASLQQLLNPLLRMEPKNSVRKPMQHVSIRIDVLIPGFKKADDMMDVVPTSQ